MTSQQIMRLRRRLLASDCGRYMTALASAEALGLAGALAVILRLRKRERVRAGQIAQLGHLALVDSLTGLRNRRAFVEELRRALGARDRGVIKARLTLAMLDLRGLKQINDALGHQAGDERLVTLSTVLREGVRESDSVYRLGGDEFMIILLGQGAREARGLLRRLGVALAECTIDVAAGIAEASGAVTPDVLIGRADRALVAAKRGPDHIVIWSPGLDRLTWTNPLDADRDSPARPPPM